MKIKQNKFKIKIDPYEAILTVIFSEDLVKTTKKICKDMDTVDDEEAVFLYDNPDSRRYTLIFAYTASPGTIAHEVTHVSLMLLNTCGVSVITNDEPLTYTVGFLVDKIWDKLTKLNSKVERLVEKDDSIKNE